MIQARLWSQPPSEQDRYLPEGPRVVSVEGRMAVAWVNIQSAADSRRGTVNLRFPETGELRRFPMPARPGFLLPTDVPDTVLLGMEKVIGTFNFRSQLWTPLATIPDDHPRTIINDGEVSPDGRSVIFGTKDVTFSEPIGHLYLFTLPDHRLTVLQSGQTCSNGKIFADNGRTLLDIDTPRKVVARYVFDSQQRTLAEQGIAIDLRDRIDFPDGMVDAGDGTVIVAFFNPHRGGDGEAVHFRLDTGEAIGRWNVPGSPRVTCPLLVSMNGQVKLILTTADEAMPTEIRSASPNAGCLFIAETTIPRLPPVAICSL